jgi:FkbM family methyltransferase
MSPKVKCIGFLKESPLKTKQNVEQFARELMFGSHFFPIARNAYQIAFARDKRANRHKMLNLYRRFISPGDLVFDVGANFGEYADAFLELGARVVAIEPQAVCHRRLELIAKRRGNMVLEKCAVADKPGSMTMHISSDSGSSTLSDRWHQYASKSPIHGSASWTDARVKVSTLDAIAAKHGVPKFIKIDVEGFEDNVLAGMQFAPSAVSFEFHFELLDIAKSCLQNPVFAGYQFNYLIAMNPELEFSKPASANELIETLSKLKCSEEFGEIFCLRG